MTLAELQAMLAEHQVSEMRTRYVQRFGIFEAKVVVRIEGERARSAWANGADIESAVKAALAQLAS